MRFLFNGNDWKFSAEQDGVGATHPEKNEDMNIRGLFQPILSVCQTVHFRRLNIVQAVPGCDCSSLVGNNTRVAGAWESSGRGNIWL